MQRTETCPPTTVTVRSRTGVELAEPVGALAGEGDGAMVDAFDVEGVGVFDAEGFAVGSVLDVPWSDAVLGPAELIEAGGSALTLALVTSWPARSMASQAVAETPATAASQIAVTPTTERSFTRMSTLCHFRGDTTPHGVPFPRGDHPVDRGRLRNPVCDHPGTDRSGPRRDHEGPRYVGAGVRRRPTT